jgi:hypothetical protein
MPGENFRVAAKRPANIADAQRRARKSLIFCAFPIGTPLAPFIA